MIFRFVPRFPPYPERAPRLNHERIYTGRRMGDWYTIGLLVGLGVALGILASTVVPRWIVAAVAAAVVAAVIGLLVDNWDEALGGAIGGVAGAVGAAPVVAGALRRGGTRGGLALFVGLGALGAAALAFVPVVGYLEALAVPALGLRLRSRAPDRHAGLRTLAKD
jgi:hypothetical protein